MLDVAACIVTHKCDLPKLQQTVESFQQQRVRASVMLVDNDSGAAYVQQLKRGLNVRVVEAGGNAGFGAGHNIGIKYAPSHRYYLVLNPDVVLHQDCLARMVEHMDANPDIGLLVPKILNPDGSLQPLNKRLPSVFDFFVRRFLPKPLQQLGFIKRKANRYIMMDVGYDAPTEIEFASGCFMLFRAQTLQEIGTFDEGFFMYLEDCDMTRRVAQTGQQVMYFPHASITHHWARGSHKSLKLMWVMIRSMWHYYQKWGWKWV